ncbi:MAG: DUF4270 domain-containing protein [Candidatus Symbiothrix sp.]|jgi:hypothetical protein|nr:DUF4270 domain-containing protein [Candidatus Symbiothrix sp.]
MKQARIKNVVCNVESVACHLFFVLVLGLFYMGCDDSISTVGMGIQPDTDKLSIFDETFTIKARTVKIDSIYAKIENGFLGEFYDPSYGTIKSGFACQFYPSVGFIAIDSIVDSKIDSVRLDIIYSSYKGDSLAPMELTVYPVIKPLEKHYYTNVDPATFCDMQNPYAKYAYTARNLTISDSILLVNGYQRWLSVSLPTQIGQDYLDGVKNNQFKTLDAFFDFFKGTYITTTFGSGSMLDVQSSQISIYYTREHVMRNAADTEDSTAYIPTRAAWAVTKEVIQLNSFKNTNDAFLLEDNPDKVYIKTPVGVFTELTIPIQEIIQRIGKKKFSSVNLSLSAYQNESWDYTMQYPGGGQISASNNAKMLLIEPDSMKNFFEKQNVANNLTSFSTAFNFSTFTYDFSNIANVVQNAIEKAPDRDLKLLLVPILTTYTTQQDYSGTSEAEYLSSHYLYPSGVALKKGEDNLKIRVIATDLKIND